MKIVKSISIFALTSAILAVGLFAQSLPVGRWQLASYKFENTVSKPLEGVKITLNVRANGQLGGNSGCNSYGGSYELADGKLKVFDVISTMMACDEPSPKFERSFFSTLSSGSSAVRTDDELTITDPQTGNYLKFVETKKIGK